MMKTIIFSASVLFSCALSAQLAGQPAQYSSNVGITDGLVLNAMGSISDKMDKLNYTDTSIEGSPYMDNSFHPAQLFYGDEPSGNIYFRYNAYNEEMEIKLKNIEGAPIKGLSKDKKIRLVSNGKEMSFKTFIDKNGNTKNGYMTTLADGKYKLYEHLKVTFKEAKKAENSFVKGSPAKFYQSTQYYLESPDGKRISQVELSNKKILQFIGGETASKLKSHLKESKLKVKGKDDLVQITNFLNTMPSNL